MKKKIVSTSLIEVIKKKILFWRTTIKIELNNAEQIYAETQVTGKMNQQVVNERLAAAYKSKPLKK